MALELTKENDGKLLIVKLTGKLTKEDYEHFTPEVDSLIKKFGNIRILLQMHDFHGWTAGALWKDIKFDLKHFTHIERLAIVGEKSWEKGMSVFCKPFTTAKIRYFTTDHRHQAEEWIRTEQPEHAHTP